MDTRTAHRRAWADSIGDNRLTHIPRPPAPLSGEPATEEEALGQQAEAHEREADDAECGSGCDIPEGPLSPSGCVW